MLTPPLLWLPNVWSVQLMPYNTMGAIIIVGEFWLPDVMCGMNGCYGTCVVQLSVAVKCGSLIQKQTQPSQFSDPNQHQPGCRRVWNSSQEPV